MDNAETRVVTFVTILVLMLILIIGIITVPMAQRIAELEQTIAKAENSNE